MITTPAPERPPLVSGWQLVALVALVLGTVVGGLLLVSPDARLEVLQNVGATVAPHFTTVLAAVAAGVAAHAARRAGQETARQTPMIETAVRQTNGALTTRDARIRELELELAARTSSEAPPSYDDVTDGGAPVSLAGVTVNVGQGGPLS